MEDDSLLELLEIYMDIVEKQDEIIYRLGKIVAKQTTDLQLLKSDLSLSDEKLEEDMLLVNEVLGQYKEMCNELEP